MTITAKQVQDLRKISGAGMMECKAALSESNGVIDEAFKILREKGIAKAGVSAAISKKLLAAVVKKSAKKATSKAKTTAKKASSKAKSTAKKAASKTKAAASKAKSAAKKASSKTKSAASKAAAAGRKVAEKTVSKAGDHKVKTEKSKDGRKGKTLKVPRSVKDMAWFNKR